MKILRISRKTAGHSGVWALLFFAAAAILAWQIVDTVRALQFIARNSGEPVRWWYFLLDCAISLMLMLCSLYAALRLTRAWWRRYQRMWDQPGVCRRCGYDLRATPERCPECGKRTRMAWRRLS